MGVGPLLCTARLRAGFSMNKTFSYLLLSPDVFRRGWAGWILSGVVARTGLELAWTGVFDASPVAAKLGAEAPKGNWGVFVFSGEEAAAKLSAATGAAGVPGSLAFMLGDGAVFAPASSESAVMEQLAALADAQAGSPDLLAAPVAPGAQRSLVLVKPDNFTHPGVRPGAVMDVFARTGLPLLAMKVHHMSVAEGMEFYGPVLDALTGKFGPEAGRDHWENIVEFMSGSRPSAVPAADHAKPGSRTILALVYEGPDAIARIRTVLGPTDPAKAPPGTIRREFGSSIMVNAAHASDAPENAQREIGLVKVADNSLKGFVESADGAA